MKERIRRDEIRKEERREKLIREKKAKKFKESREKATGKGGRFGIVKYCLRILYGICKES